MWKEIKWDNKKRIEEELMQKISFAPGADTDIRRN